MKKEASIEKSLQNQHLYITTDEDFMSGEWVLFSDVVMIAKSFDDRVVYDGEGNSFMKYDCKKIIATTDPKLRSDSLIEDPARPEDNLLIRKGIPKIPQSLIESYCKNPVDKVEVEYEWWQDQDNTGAGIENIGEPELILKLTSNNEIIISVIEERLYDRDEMWQCVAQSHITRKDMKNPFDELPEWFDKWVKETL